MDEEADLQPQAEVERHLEPLHNAEARGSTSWLVYVAHGEASAALGYKGEAVRAYAWLLKHAQLAPEARLEIEGRIRMLLDGEDGGP